MSRPVQGLIYLQYTLTYLQKINIRISVMGKTSKVHTWENYHLNAAVREMYSEVSKAC